ncbi:hypothetical protein G9A89_001056, partial [Geosiphon pyriformis]
VPSDNKKSLQTSSNLFDFLAENQSEHFETAANEENKPEISEEELIDSENEENEMTTYITKILNLMEKTLRPVPKNGLIKLLKQEMQMDGMLPESAFLEQFTDNNTSITFRNRFRNIKQELSESIRPHVPEDLNSVIQHAKRYKMAMEEANCTKLKPAQQPRKKLTNSQRRLKTISPINNNSNPKDINHPKNEIKITLHHFPITSLRIAITVESLTTGKKIAESYNETNKIGLIQQQYQQPPTQYYQIPVRRLITQNQFTPQNRYQVNNNRISSNNQLVPRNTTLPKPNHYHTQPSYLTMPEEQNFHHTALSEGRAAAQQQQNPSYTFTTISPARIAENINLSDIFPFEFKANESPFLLSNAAANEQKAITAMYTETKVEGKTIHLILDTQTVIITADGMKKTPVGEIDNFPFTLDGITIPVKVLVPAICGTFNKCPEKAPAFEFEPEGEKSLIETFMALGSMSNWADETKQEHFTPYTKPETSGWNIPYPKYEPRKQRSYIPLKYMLPKECNWIDVAMRGKVCDQTCQYVLLISEKVKRGTPFNAAYNSALNKLYHYSYDAEMIFDLAIALINGATKEDVRQMKEAEYIEYTIELAEFNNEDKVEVYHQITSHTYPTQEAQIQ